MVGEVKEVRRGVGSANIDLKVHDREIKPIELLMIDELTR